MVKVYIVLYQWLTIILYRLALSHNFIFTFPARFSECTSLRYLNVRNNVIRDFPLAVCDDVPPSILSAGLILQYRFANCRRSKF